MKYICTIQDNIFTTGMLLRQMQFGHIMYVQQFYAKGQVIYLKTEQLLTNDRSCVIIRLLYKK